jgi:hypothetical protein
MKVTPPLVEQEYALAELFLRPEQYDVTILVPRQHEQSQPQPLRELVAAKQIGLYVMRKEGRDDDRRGALDYVPPSSSHEDRRCIDGMSNRILENFHQDWGDISALPPGDIRQIRDAGIKEAQKEQGSCALLGGMVIFRTLRPPVLHYAAWYISKAFKEGVTYCAQDIAAVYEHTDRVFSTEERKRNAVLRGEDLPVRMLVRHLPYYEGYIFYEGHLRDDMHIDSRLARPLNEQYPLESGRVGTE